MPRQALAEGDLPAVCVRTGRPADSRVRIRTRTLPTWTLVLLLFGVLPFLVAVTFAGEEVMGQVPVRRAVVERHRHRRRLAIGLGAATILLVVVGMAGGSPPAAWAGAVCGVAAAAIEAWRRATWITARPDRTGVWVRMGGVHDGFADAVVADGAGLS